MTGTFVLARTVDQVTTLTSFEVFKTHAFMRSISFKTENGVKSGLIIIEPGSKSPLPLARERYGKLQEAGYAPSNLELYTVEKVCKINDNTHWAQTAKGGINND